MGDAVLDRELEERIHAVLQVRARSLASGRGLSIPRGHRGLYTASMESSIGTPDGVRLHVREWPCAAARGTVHLVHGLGEHVGRYAELAVALNGWGWRVVGHDQRGHGRSEGARGALPTDDSLLSDLAQVMDATHLPQGGPRVLLGHSLGGLVAARFVAEGLQATPAHWHRGVDALVLSSPALDAGMSGAQKALLALLGPLAPGLAVDNGLKPAWISRDPAVVAAYVADPLVHDRVTPRLVRFIVDAGEFVQARAPAWRVPTLLMWAGSDRCVAPRGSAAFAAAAPVDVLEAREFAPLYHEIFNEPERAEVFELPARLAGRVRRPKLAPRREGVPHECPRPAAAAATRRSHRPRRVRRAHLGRGDRAGADRLHRDPRQKPDVRRRLGALGPHRTRHPRRGQPGSRARRSRA